MVHSDDFYLKKVFDFTLKGIKLHAGDSQLVNEDFIPSYGVYDKTQGAIHQLEDIVKSKNAILNCEFGFGALYYLFRIKHTYNALIDSALDIHDYETEGRLDDLSNERKKFYEGFINNLNGLLIDVRYFVEDFKNGTN